MRDLALEGVKQAAYFIAQARWLHQHFPHAEYVDAPGLCRAITQQEIEENDCSLTPGRYVGVAPVEEENPQDFAERMREIHSELAELNEKSLQLAEQIQINITGLME